MSSKWVECKFEDILSIPIRNGLSKPKAVRGTGVKMVNMGEIFRYSRIYDIDMERVPTTDKELITSRLVAGDLLFARQSLVLEGAGKCSIIMETEEDLVYESHLIRARLNNKIAQPSFYFYYFNSPIGKGNVRSIVEQVAAAGIRGSDLKKLSIPLPPLPEQKTIAATLSCLDDMAELNNRTNQVLEEMAQAIFKHWFVDFEFPNENGQPYKSSGGKMIDSELGEIPEGWRVGRFNELVDKTISGDWGKANPQGKFTQKVVCVRGADIPEIAKGNKGNAPYRYINTKNLANKALGPHEMIVEISGGSPAQSTGRCALISEDLINLYEVPILCTNFCRAIKFTKPEYSYFVYGNWKYKYNNDIFFQYENGTTGIKNLDFFGVLTREPIIIPTDRLLTVYSKTLVTFTKTICEKAAENNVFSNTRDTLLPKLMSGEIRVPVEEVG